MHRHLLPSTCPSGGTTRCVPCCLPYAVLTPPSRPCSNLGSTDYPMLCSGPNIHATLAAGGRIGSGQVREVDDAQLQATLWNIFRWKCDLKSLDFNVKARDLVNNRGLFSNMSQTKPNKPSLFSFPITHNDNSRTVHAHTELFQLLWEGCDVEVLRFKSLHFGVSVKIWQLLCGKVSTIKQSLVNRCCELAPLAVAVQAKTPLPEEHPHLQLPCSGHATVQHDFIVDSCRSLHITSVKHEWRLRCCSQEI